MKHWILIADSSRARIVSRESAEKPLELEHEMDFPLGRARDQEIVSDEPGRLRKGGTGGVLSAMDPQTTAHEAEAQQFARELSKTVAALHFGEHDRLAIVAPPHFLGQLKKDLSSVVRKRIAGFVPKDLTHVGLQELPQHLADIRWS